MIRLVAFSLALVTGCAARIDETPVPPGSAPAAIVDGSPHDGDPATLEIEIEGRVHCTGSLIAPRAVLTARHCIEDVQSGRRAPASSIDVFSGRFGGRDLYAHVEDYAIADGAIMPLRDVPTDVAVLILDRAGDVRPYTFVREASELRGQRIIGIGYGLTNEGTSGEKYRGASVIDMVGQNSFTTEGPLVCLADAGGPALLADGRLIGVAHGIWGERSVHPEVACAISMYIRTDVVAAFLDAAVARAGGYGAEPGGSAFDGGIPLPNDAGIFYPPVDAGAPVTDAGAGLAPVLPPGTLGMKPADSTTGEPTYGTEHLEPGFTPQPRIVRGLSGGNIAAPSIDGACAGFIANSPDHVLSLDRDFGYIRIVVSGGDNDTTLVIRAPDGTFICADDSDGSQPIVAGAASSGTYRVWIGNHLRGTTPPYALGISESPDLWSADVR